MSRPSRCVVDVASCHQSLRRSSSSSCCGRVVRVVMSTFEWWREGGSRVRMVRARMRYLPHWPRFIRPSSCRRHVAGVDIVVASWLLCRQRRVVAAAPLSRRGHAIASVVACVARQNNYAPTSGLGIRSSKRIVIVVVANRPQVVVTSSWCDAGTPHCDRPSRCCAVRRARYYSDADTGEGGGAMGQDNDDVVASS